MRRLRVLLVVAVLASGWSMPAMAEGGAAGDRPWAAFAESIVGWVEGVWRVVAGSEAAAPTLETGDDADGLPTGSGETTDLQTSDAEGEKFPGLDPNG